MLKLTEAALLVAAFNVVPYSPDCLTESVIHSAPNFIEHAGHDLGSKRNYLSTSEVSALQYRERETIPTTAAPNGDRSEGRRGVE